MNVSVFARSVIVSILGGGGTRLLLIVVTFVCTHYLSKEDFGELAFIRNTLNLVLSVCAVNFSALCVTFVGYRKTDGGDRLCLLLIFCAIICACFCLLVGLYPDLIFRSSSIGAILIGYLLPLFVLQPLLEAVLKGYRKFRLVSIIQLFSALFFLITTIVGIYLMGQKGALAAIVLYYLFLSIVTIVLSFSYTYPLVKNVTVSKLRESTPVLYKEIIPLFLLSFVDVPVFWVIQSLLESYGSLSDVGNMTVVLQIRNLIMIVPSYFFSTFLAFANEIKVKQDWGDYHNKVSRYIRVLLIVGCVSIVVCLCFSDWLLGLYGTSYRSEGYALLGAILALPSLLVIGIYRVHVTIMSRQREFLGITIVWNVVWLVSFIVISEQKLISPPEAFFFSQLLGVLILHFGLWMLYRKDKRNQISLSYEN